MYFRILVNQNGAKFFRTSRIPTATAAWNVLVAFQEAFTFEEGYTLEVLKVTGQPVGEILPLQDLAESVTAEAQAAD